MRILLISLFCLSVFRLFAQDEIDPNGYNKFYHETGEIASEGNFKNGKPEGYWKTYYPNGNIKSEAID